MSVIYILLAISLVVALVFLIAFFYAVGRGQYDDSHTPAVRILFDDEVVRDPPEKTESQNHKSKSSDSDPPEAIKEKSSLTTT